MMNQFRVCNKCKATNIDTLIPRLKELDNNAEIIVGCQNFCGIGAKKSFVICNHVPIVAESEDEVIDKVKKAIEKKYIF